MCEEIKVCRSCKEIKKITMFYCKGKTSVGVQKYSIDCAVCIRASRRTTPPKRIVAHGFKFCSFCQEDLPLGEFTKNKNKKDGRDYHCRKCSAAKRAKKIINPKPTAKNGYKYCSCCGIELAVSNFTKNKNSPDKLEYRCRECVAKYWANLPDDKRKASLDRGKKWRKDNPESVAKALRNNGKKPKRRLISNLRRRVTKAISCNYKSGSAVRDLGCSINWLKDYLEWHFYGDMSWNNHGTVWHIDHIILLASLDLEDREQFKIAVHYTNLQPLLVHENLSKGAKLDWNREEINEP